MKYSAIEIGKKIRQNREELGLTQGQLGEMLSKNIAKGPTVFVKSKLTPKTAMVYTNTLNHITFLQ